MKKLFIFLMLSALAGCASFTQSTSAELLVQYATIKFINNSDSPVPRAQKVVEIAASAKSYFDNETLPIDEIETLIRQKIDWQELDAADTLLANALILRVKDEIDASSTLDEEKRVSGSTVLGWIIEGARLVGG